MTAPAWWPDGRGETWVLVASGPSAADVPLARARGRARFLAVNDSWRLCPWADVLYACDADWWGHARGAPGFAGLKLTADSTVRRDDVRHITVERGDRLVLAPIGTVGWGANGGFHALNLAVQFGAERILLVGYDMTVERGLHWHGRHPNGMRNPTPEKCARWRAALDGVAGTLAALDVEVINCSPASALEAYPKMAFEEALA